MPALIWLCSLLSASPPVIAEKILPLKPAPRTRFAMNTQQAYDSWASQYDTNHNKTRDLEGQAMQATLASLSFARCLEIGCGTGKNTAWLLEKAAEVTAVDLSAQMLARARAKIPSPRVQFIQADITTSWTFLHSPYDLVSFSLVLEHLENLEPIFQQAARHLNPGGHIYLGELHPFKQYSGTKARFDTPEGRQVVPCFNHHLSDFLLAARKQGLELVEVNEFFDHPDRKGIPRILTILIKKPYDKSL
jgi:SAM-dependent methyltransferase